MFTLEAADPDAYENKKGNVILTNRTKNCFLIDFLVYLIWNDKVFALKIVTIQCSVTHVNNVHARRNSVSSNIAVGLHFVCGILFRNIAYIYHIYDKCNTSLQANYFSDDKD